MKYILYKFAMGYITVLYWLEMAWYYLSKPFKKPIILTTEEKAILLARLKELQAIAVCNRDEWCKHR